MKLIYLLVLLFLSLGSFAQVCGISKNKEGEITRYAHVQFGKDTIVIGVPYKVKDKLGMTFDFSTTKNKTHFLLNLRSVDMKLLSDSVKIDSSYLLLTMNNNDTLKIIPLKALPPYHGVIKRSGTITVFFNSYLNLERLITLAGHKLANVKYYINGQSYIDLPVTSLEIDKLKKAADYLLK